MLLLPSEWEVLLWTLKQTYFFLHFYTFSVWEYVCAHTSELMFLFLYLLNTASLLLLYNVFYKAEWYFDFSEVIFM